MNRTTFTLATVLAAALTTLGASAQAADPGASLMVTNYFLTKNFVRGTELKVQTNLVTPKNAAWGDKIVAWDPATKVVYASSTLPIVPMSVMTATLTLDNAAAVGPVLELAYLRPGTFGGYTKLATGQELRVVLDPATEGLIATTGTLQTSALTAAQLAGVHDTKLANLDARASAFATFQALATALQNVHEAKLAAHDQAIQLHDALAAIHEAKLAATSGKLAEHDGKLALQQALLDEHSVKQTQTSADVAQANAKIANLESHVNALQNAADQPAVYVDSAEATSSTCAAVTVNASCEAGDFATSGGCDVGDSDDWRLVKSTVQVDDDGRPVGWTCKMRSNTTACAAATVTVDVVCQGH